MFQTTERPLGGTLLTPGGKLALTLAALALGFAAVRLFTGLGPVTAMNDGYPWGVWKPLNVVTFTGIGAGALGLALVVSIAKRGLYHPLVRSAVLTGAIAYTLAGLSVIVDLGRWWTVWALLVPTFWNLSSVLLEVALCVMAYCAVLWIELVPALLERLASGRDGRLRRLAMVVRPRLDRALPYVLAAAVVLPFMHQSSLGSLFLVAPTKLHPLWYSGWLPVLFLVSCLVMGFGAVIVVDTLTHHAFRRAHDTRLHSQLSLVMAILALAFVAIRMADVAWSGALGALHGWRGVLFLTELALFAYPALRLLGRWYRSNAGRVFWAAQLAVMGGALYRFDTYLGAFMPGAGFRYFPSVGELVFSLGLAGAGVALYLALARALPILSGVRAVSATSARRGRAAGASA